ncbi:MAG: glycosyltransferase family 9 protein [bacterium]
MDNINSTRRRIIAVAHWADTYIGCILCYILSLFYFLRRYKSVHQAKPKNILVMKFWESGCIILASPCFRALREKYPDVRITFLTLAVNKEICGMLGFADEIIALDIQKGIIRFAFQIFKLVPCLRRKQYDLLFDLEFLSRFSALVTFGIAPRQSYGFSSPGYWRGNFHTQGVYFNPLKHVTDNFKDIFVKAGINVDTNVSCSIDIKTDGITNLISEDYIVINLNRNINLQERCWPDEYYEKLVTSLVHTVSLKIVLISSTRNSWPMAVHYSDKIVDLCGKLTFAELGGLLQHARFFITHDSGPMHLAAALGVPVVSFFGPETPDAYGPKGNKHLIFFKGLSCSPCINIENNKQIRCIRETNECIRSITVEEVIEGMRGKGLI